MNNKEIYGISCEVAIMEYYNIPVPKSYLERSLLELTEKLKLEILPKVNKIFKTKGLSVSQYSGENAGVHDFILSNGQTLSVKSNLGYLGKVCPQIIGQPTSNKMFEYLINNNLYSNEIPDTYEEKVYEFKKFVYENIELMLNEYWKNLMSSDFLLYFYNIDKDNIKYFILDNNLFKPKFSEVYFMKTLNEWESNNYVRIGDKTIGEFQIHTNRNCFKFRFYMNNIFDLLYYEKNNIHIERNDYLRLLKKIQDNSVDLLIIDPPYHIDKDINFNKGKITNSNADRFRIEYDKKDKESKTFLNDLIKECYRILKSSGTVIFFYDLWKIETLKNKLEQHKFKQLRFCEWIKSNPVPINSKLNYLSNAREIFITATKKGKPTFNSEYDNGIYTYPIYQDGKRFHPNQKPIQLFNDLIEKHSQEGDLIVDCFLGSGTTAVSCINTNRRLISCELDVNYYLQSVERTEEHLKDN